MACRILGPLFLTPVPKCVSVLKICPSGTCSVHIPWATYFFDTRCTIRNRQRNWLPRTHGVQIPGATLCRTTAPKMRNCQHTWPPGAYDKRIPMATCSRTPAPKMRYRGQCWSPGTYGVQIPRTNFFRTPAPECVTVSKFGLQAHTASRFLGLFLTHAAKCVKVVKICPPGHMAAWWYGGMAARLQGNWFRHLLKPQVKH